MIPLNLSEITAEITEINFQTAVFKAGAGIDFLPRMISEGALIKAPALSEVLSSLALLRFYQSESVATQKHSLQKAYPGACLENCRLEIDFRDVNWHILLIYDKLSHNQLKL